MPEKRNRCVSPPSLPRECPRPCRIRDIGKRRIDAGGDVAEIERITAAEPGDCAAEAERLIEDQIARPPLAKPTFASEAAANSRLALPAGGSRSRARSANLFANGGNVTAEGALTGDGNGTIAALPIVSSVDGPSR